MWIRLIVIVSLLSTISAGRASQALAAEFTYTCGAELCAVTLKGDIIAGDYDRLKSVLSEISQMNKVARKIVLFSNGGNVTEGLNIGRLVRKNLIFTESPEIDLYIGFDIDGMPDEKIRERCKTECFQFLTDGATRSLTNSRKAIEIGAVSTFGNKFQFDSDIICASSCALIALAGVERTGTIGLHHIYSSKNSPDYDSLNTLLENSIDDVEIYLKEMRSPSEIITAILSTPSNELSWIELKDELQRDRIFYEYSIDGCNPLSKEERKALLKLSMLNKIGFFTDLETNEYTERSLSQEEVSYLEKLDTRQSNFESCSEMRKRKAQRSAQF